jgi:uncharacterized membrane protein
MTEELTKTEARQGDRRRMNVVALVGGLIIVVVVFVLIYAVWA